MEVSIRPRRSHSNSFGNDAEKNTAGCRALNRKYIVIGGGLDAIGISKSWFAVLNNPADHGYTGTPQEVCEKLRSEWLSVSDSRTGAWVYCVSAEGLHHVHIVLEDRVAMRFSKIKKSYAVGMHFEATKGNKDQAEAYITKQPPFDEKGEQSLYTCRHGEIQAVQGRRPDVEKISAL